MHPSLATLNDAIDHIRRAPSDRGSLDLIVCRPEHGRRLVLERARLDSDIGLEGDNWTFRPSSRTEDGGPHPDMQLNVMSSRVIAAIAVEPHRWALAGDQLYVDLDLSEANLPAGTRLTVGSAVIEVTDQPHTGCQKFSQRFGVDSLRFVNSAVGKSVRARGLNARVVEPGDIARGDTVSKIRTAADH